MARSGRTGISSIVFGSRFAASRHDPGAGIKLRLAGLQPRRCPGADATIANPILFVTQVPVPTDFTTITSPFGNHLGTVASAARRRPLDSISRWNAQESDAGRRLWQQRADRAPRPSPCVNRAFTGTRPRRCSAWLLVRQPPSTSQTATSGRFTRSLGPDASRHQ